MLLACMTVEEARGHGQKLLEEAKAKNIINDPSSRGLTFMGTEESESKTLTNVAASVKLPSLLEERPNLEAVAAVGRLDTPLVRLALLGGVHGFLKEMSQRKVKADVKLCTFLLEMIGQDEQSESTLLALMVKFNVRPDAIFLNKLIRRRALRGERKLGMDTLDIFAEYAVAPDIVTFGVLALCVRSRRASDTLLKDLDARGHRANEQILNTLVRAAERHRDAAWAADLVGAISRHMGRATPKLLTYLENFRRRYAKEVRLVERAKEKVKLDKDNQENFQAHPAIVIEVDQHNLANWSHFLSVYENFLKSSEVEPQVHPWRQFLTEKDMKTAEKDKDFAQIISNNEEGPLR